MVYFDWLPVAEALPVHPAARPTMHNVSTRANTIITFAITVLGVLAGARCPLGSRCAGSFFRILPSFVRAHRLRSVAAAAAAAAAAGLAPLASRLTPARSPQQGSMRCPCIS